MSRQGGIGNGQDQGRSPSQGNPQDHGPEGPQRFGDADTDFDTVEEAIHKDQGKQWLKDPERGPSGGG